jgi:hypothetical protein
VSSLKYTGNRVNPKELTGRARRRLFSISLSIHPLTAGNFASKSVAFTVRPPASKPACGLDYSSSRVPTEDGGTPIDIIVDFLMPRDAEIVKNVPPLISDFAVQRADGADLAIRFYQWVAITGPMPAGGTNRVEIAVCSIPALLAMKGHAIALLPLQTCTSGAGSASFTTIAISDMSRPTLSWCWRSQRVRVAALRTNSARPREPPLAAAPERHQRIRLNRICQRLQERYQSLSFSER